MSTFVKFTFVLALVALSLFICSSCFAYSLDTIFGKDVPWYVDLIGGVALNGLNIPIAVICWIIRLVGVQTPLMSS